TDWIAEAAASQSVLDLAPYLASGAPEGYPNAWTPSLLRFQQVGARVLGLPYHDGPECLIYRKSLFEGLGLSPPATWDEFHRMARLLTRPAENLYGAVFVAFPDGDTT